MKNFFAGLFILLGVGCLGAAGFNAYQERVISPQVSNESSPTLFFTGRRYVRLCFSSCVGRHAGR